MSKILKELRNKSRERRKKQRRRTVANLLPRKRSIRLQMKNLRRFRDLQREHCGNMSQLKRRPKLNQNKTREKSTKNKWRDNQG